MKGMGASPESLERAMKANARELADTRKATNPFAANIEGGTADAARAMHSAKFARAGQNDKAMDKLLKVQEDALKALKDGMKIEVTVEEITI